MENDLDFLSQDDVFDEEEDEGLGEESEPIQNRKLFTDKADRSLADLYRMIEHKDLNLRPSYQRDFIWQPKQMSLFIESLLIKIPIPTIFFAENPDGTIEVIDGQQRLTSVYKFMKNDFKLNNLRTLPEYNGAYYSDFDERTKRTFDNSTLFTVTVKIESTPEIKFDIFSRINQGSIKLNDQELRNAIYRGPLIDKTLEFSESNEVILRTFKKNTVSRKRRSDMDFILRLLSLNAMVENNVLSSNYNGRIGDSIILYLETNRENKVKIEQDFISFEETLDKITKIFNNNEFRIYNYEEEKYFVRINKTVADLQYIVFSRIDIDENKLSEYESVFNRFVFDNLDYFKTRTGNTSAFEARLKVFEKIRNI